MRRAAKVDANQDQVVSALRAAGASVQSLAPIGKGCPDLLVSFKDGLFLFEVKNKHGKNEVNEAQQKWHIAWNGTVHIVYDAEQALKVIGAIA